MRSEFGNLCRDLRIAHGLKQREVASGIGISPGAYGNLESSPFKVVRKDKAKKIAELYRLDVKASSDLMAAWERCPLSEGGEKRRAIWQQKNAQRSKAKRHDALEVALCEMLGVHIGAMDEDKICVCEFAGDPCEVCAALGVLGLDPYSTRDNAITQLAKLQEKLVAKRDAAKETA
jgi:transcriptional regulator with XRE-family HTH domain